MNKNELIHQLKMNEHREGGYFAETFKSSYIINLKQESQYRNLLSSIYYMLTDNSPIGFFHINKSDILHFYHLGSPISYFTIDPAGHFDTFILGPNVNNGHYLQKLVKGGTWKASVLKGGEFGLLGEAVSPGFDYSDSEIGTSEQIKKLFPNLWNEISYLVKKG